MDSLCTLPAVEIAARIRAGTLSPVEAVEAHIGRIQAVNPHINAVCVDRFDAARQEARQAEAAVRAGGELPPFHGVPCTIKELIAVEGLPWTAGVVARKHIRATQDAPQVARLREAGAIIMGLTNISEAGLWLESDNKVYGRTRNPWDTRRMAGGSSGGEAAVIGAGGSPMGLGADIGGSIRNPSFFNGVCGHKASGGLLPSTGHWPPADSDRARYCITGPMARTVEDLTAMMRVLSPPVDPYRDADRAPFAARSIDPAKTRVFTFDGTGLARVDRDMKAALGKTADALSDAGFQVESWKPKGLARSAEIWSAKLAVTGDPTVREFLGDGTPIDLGREWARWPFRKSNHPLISLLMASLESVSHMGKARTQKLLDLADDIRTEIENKLGSDGVLLFPPYPRSAPRHRAPLLNPLAFTFCGIVNVLELPATAVPTGFDRRQMPLGLQVVGSRFEDALTLAVAAYVQGIWGPWRPAPVSD
jgi:fatty acid amide hydrolase 2